MSHPPRNLWKIGFILALIALIILVAVGYRFRGHVLSAFGWLASETGGNTMAVFSIALSICVLVCAVFWLIFPILVYLGLKDLRRRVTALDETLRIAATPPDERSGANFRRQTTSTG